jgi:hypothetical protein
MMAPLDWKIMNIKFYILFWNISCLRKDRSLRQLLHGASSELTPTNVGAAAGCDLLIFDPYKKLV